MTKDQYLDKLRWDKSQYQVMTKEECDGLQDKPGAVNHMYKISEPSGKEAFGKDAFVVNIKFADKFLNEEVEVAVAVNTETAPPPTVPDNIPPPPPIKSFSAPTKPVEPRNKEGLTAQENLEQDQAITKELDEVFVKGVPEEIKEIAKASPNVIIATIPKDEEEDRWPAYVRTRSANLISTGKWKYIGDEIIRHESGKTMYYQDLDDMDNINYTELLKDAQGTKTALPSADVIKAAQEKAKADREKVLYELGVNRIGVLVINGCEKHFDSENTLAGIDCPDGEAYGINRIAEMENKEWIAMTVKYSPKGVADIKAEIKAEAVTDKKEEPVKAERTESAVDAYESSKARRQALHALGWKDDPKYAKYVTNPKGGGLTHDEVLNMPEADFKKLLSIPVAVPIVTKEMEETATKNAKTVADENEAADKAEAVKARALEKAAAEYLEPVVSKKEITEVEQQNKVLEETLGKPKEGSAIESKGIDILDVSEIGVGKSMQPSIDINEFDVKVDFENNRVSRDKLALKIMFALIPNAGTKKADTIAQYAYDLTDAMIKLKLKK